MKGRTVVRPIQAKIRPLNGRGRTVVRPYNVNFHIIEWLNSYDL